MLMCALNVSVLRFAIYWCWSTISLTLICFNIVCFVICTLGITLLYKKVEFLCQFELCSWTEFAIVFLYI